MKPYCQFFQATSLHNSSGGFPAVRIQAKPQTHPTLARDNARGHRCAKASRWLNLKVREKQHKKNLRRLFIFVFKGQEGFM